MLVEYSRRWRNNEWQAYYQLTVFAYQFETVKHYETALQKGGFESSSVRYLPLPLYDQQLIAW